ncbi:hypothetical protein AVEN_113076-1 [Araneus ventricosus]|uniref:Uncharacterized protein n=1 Tax=Araneus ventricosus TaxID=182803 RepID=A0A4Y2IPN0_ARAVE|nr:hypothetical protein AVEN_113076-1 [Araneus ventricosus]
MKREEDHRKRPRLTTKTSNNALEATLIQISSMLGNARHMRRLNQESLLCLTRWADLKQPADELPSCCPAPQAAAQRVQAFIWRGGLPLDGSADPQCEC